MSWTIAAETRGDEGGIDVVHLASFPTSAEADLVWGLRAAGDLTVSLVASVAGAVVGHVALSPVSHEGADARAVGLGPVAVLPSWRGRGVAAALVRAGLEASAAAGFARAFVLGGPRYYERFGFEPAPRLGWSDEYGGGDAFQVVELPRAASAAHPPGGGLVRYAEAFSRVPALDPATVAPLPALAMIFAIGERGELGRAGQVPWSLPSDRAYFDRTTRGHAVIMGRRTWEETGATLPERVNLIVSASASLHARGATVVRSLGQAIARARERGAFPFVIGGARLFQEATALATRVFVTHVPRTIADADVFFRLDQRGLREVSSRLGPEGERYATLAREVLSTATPT